MPAGESNQNGIPTLCPSNSAGTSAIYICFNKMPQQDNDKRREYNKKYCRKRYLANKKYYLTRVKKRIQRLKKWYKNYKSKLKCSRCPENNPACLDFHHKKGKKEELISRMIYVKGWGIERMLKEIEKCEVLCSNCHRKLHFGKKT